MISKYKMSKSGFTLVELLIVIVIIAMMLAFVIPNFSDARKQSRDAKRKADLESVRSALELRKANNDFYPTGCPTTPLHNCSTLRTALEPQYITKLPSDSGSTTGYRYVPIASSCIGGNCTQYVMGATLESENPGGTSDDGCGVSLNCGGGLCNYCVSNP